ncbi:MAG: retroviral-like aspartic protease family protein [Kiritimatiellae bacterium]|nr:retroviral-like aspartic protease family protein [Kiritimatiellia bacterium]
MPETLCGFNDVPGGASGAEQLVAYGPTIKVDIGFDATYKSASGVRPVPGIHAVDALVDTGATECCIDSMLATQLNLPIVDRRQIAGIHGRQEINIHLAQVHIPSLNFTMYGMFAGVHLAAGGQPHKALIGRTFLRHCTMAYEGKSGTVRIATS